MPIFVCHLKKIVVITSPKCGSTSLRECFENIEHYEENKILQLLNEYKIYIVYNENIKRRFLSGFYEDLINNSCYDEMNISFSDYIDILYNIHLNKTKNVNKIQHNNKEYDIWWGECSNNKSNITNENGVFVSHIQTQKYSTINYSNIFEENHNVELLKLKDISFLTNNIHKNKSEKKHDFLIEKLDITNILLKDIKKNVLIHTQNIFSEEIEKKIIEMYEEDEEYIYFLKLKFKHSNMNENK